MPGSGAESDSWGFITVYSDLCCVKEGHPEHHFSDGFTKESLLNVCIAASVLIAFGATTYCLSTGIFIVFSHLFYIPIVLAAYRYPERGVAFAGALAAGYFAEVLYFSPGDGVEIANALLRIAMFFVVAVVVSNLSGRLQARESRYRGIFEMSGAGIFLFSPKTGKIAEMNRECSAMLGYPDDDVPSLEVPAIWPGYPWLAGALEEGRIEGLDCSLAGRDGMSCPVLLSAGLLPGRQEGCVVVTGTAELKRLESRLRRSEETLRVILDTTDVGILLTAPGLQVVEANAAAIRLFGGAGRNPYDLVAGRNREEADTVSVTVADTGPGIPDDLKPRRGRGGAACLNTTSVARRRRAGRASASTSSGCLWNAMGGAAVRAIGSPATRGRGPRSRSPCRGAFRQRSEPNVYLFPGQHVLVPVR
ncbi:MAG: hypothetical protein PWR21_1714 [Methanoculleus sp.]|nr:hypothetical protein [Methanoculleus sp.]